MRLPELLQAQHEEPILDKARERYYHHVSDEELRQMYVDHFSLFWSPQEVNPAADDGDWERLSADERHFISMVLAFFAAADGIVFANISRNFSTEVVLPEARSFYGFQGMIENVHSETYMKILQCYVQEKAEQDRLVNAVDTIASIRRKAAWAQKYMDGALPFAVRLVAFAIVEGVFFSGSFCAIFWLKSTKPGMLEALTFSNQLISRDEGMHCDFAVALFKRLRNTPDEDVVHDMVREAVAAESEFTMESLQVALIGIHAESMAQFIKYTGDRLLASLGYRKLYHAANPFPFMDNQSMRISTNFFESRVAEYALAPEGDYSDAAVF